MDIKMNDPKGSTAVRPEKLYSQDEVNGLRKDWEAGPSSRARQIEEEVQTAEKRKRLEDKTVAGLVSKSNRILTSISSHAFPFDFFPDTINVEDSRLTIINRHFLSSEVHSIDIKNISNIFINKTIFFSQLVIISKTFEENQIKIRYLRNKEAVFVRRIIEGLRVFESKQITTSGYTKDELLSKLEELSTTQIVT